MENFEIDKIEDIRQSKEYGKFLKEIGWDVVKIKDVQIFVKKLGPVAIAKIQRVKMPLPWKEINKFLKERRVFMTILEPINYNEEIYRQGFKLDKWPMIGNKTLVVSLNNPKFKKDARYVLRKLKDVQYASNNFDEFFGIWKIASKRKKLWVPPEKDYKKLVASFGNKCFCINADHTAGALILIHKNVAYYYYAGNKSKNDLPYGIVKEAMQEAKRRGCKWWNWEGVYDSRWPNKGWLGFTHFKQSFGGFPILYPGTYVRWSWPI